MVRLIVTATLLVLVDLAANNGAHADVWCMHQRDGSAAACVFPSGEDCTRAAIVSATGGICERKSGQPVKTEGQHHAEAWQSWQDWQNRRK